MTTIEHINKILSIIDAIYGVLSIKYYAIDFIPSHSIPPTDLFTVCYYYSIPILHMMKLRPSGVKQLVQDHITSLLDFPDFF